jgi:hypothetical protein
MRPILITGCQRSGTAYTSALFTASGHWCSHERFYNEHAQYPLRPETIESSHAAAPFLADIPEDTLVVHLVRHPLAVVSSLLANRKFSGKKPASVKFARKHAPQILNESDNELQAVMRYWVEWNALVDPVTSVTWRLETFTPGEVMFALDVTGRTWNVGNVRKAFAIVPESVNASTRDIKQLTWDDIPTGALGSQLRTAARRYGYDA